jgi:hypothetical protein
MLLLFEAELSSPRLLQDSEAVLLLVEDFPIAMLAMVFLK